MDEVMADALAEHVRRCEAQFGLRLTASELRGRHVHEAVGPSLAARVLALTDASFFEDLAVMPGAQDVIAELSEEHEIVIATAAMDVPCSFEPKFRWLARHFPFIPPSHIVFCGDKSVLDVDDLIDDSPRHFARLRGRGILFSAPHNCHETRYLRVDSWEDVRELYASEREERKTGTLAFRSR
jgi:5'(3')-deoxyribonucleotidase